MGVEFKNEMGERSEDGQKGALKELIVRDLRSKALLAHAVEKKSLGEKGYIVDAIVADVLWTGYSKVSSSLIMNPLCFRYLPRQGSG